MQLNLYM